VFSENGLVAYKGGELVAVQSLRWGPPARDLLPCSSKTAAT
jgi:hypothetical protein